jgi:TRAP-type C4-dicarboxylate transport system substrate-binding protein
MAAMLLPAASLSEEFKIATVAPADSQWMTDMTAGAERIRELTAGRVVFKFRAGGVAGSDEAVLRKIRIGELQGGAMSAGALGAVYAGLNVYGIPLIFRSIDEIDFIRSRLDQKLAAGLEQAGFVSLGFSEGGFSNLLSNEPVSHVDDLRRRKVWVPDNDAISFQVLRALNLAPVPLEVTSARLGIRSGLVDVVAASPVVALVLQWHTEVKYRTELPISYSMGVFALAADAFAELSAADQEVVRSVMREVMAGIDEASRPDNARAQQIMEDMGVRTVNVNAADVDEWRAQIAAQYPDLLARRDIDSALFNEMLTLLEEYRSTR